MKLPESYNTVTSSKLDTSSKHKLKTHNFILLTEEGKIPTFQNQERVKFHLKVYGSIPVKRAKESLLGFNLE